MYLFAKACDIHILLADHTPMCTLIQTPQHKWSIYSKFYMTTAVAKPTVATAHMRVRYFYNQDTHSKLLLFNYSNRTHDGKDFIRYG